MQSTVGIAAPRNSVADGQVVGLRLVKTPGRSTAARIRQVIVASEAAADLLTIVLAVLLSYAVYSYFSWESSSSILPRSSGVGVRIRGHHGPHVGSGRSLSRSQQPLAGSGDRTGTARFGQALLFALAVSFFSSILFSRWVLVLCLVLVPLALFFEKSLMYLLTRALHSRGLGLERVLVYGSGGTGRRVFSVLTRSPKLGLEPVAFVERHLKNRFLVFGMGYERGARHALSLVR